MSIDNEQQQPNLLAATSTVDIAALPKNLSVAGYQPWWHALKQVWPIYLSIHLVMLLLSYLATLFRFKNFSTDQLPPSLLWESWKHWDTIHFIVIATRGYDAPWRTAFFPFFPILQAGLTFLVRDPFIAGLLISNVATLVLFVVLYRLVEVDFQQSSLAYRTVLYLALFPTAFFLMAAYNESLFLCLTLLSFYQMRRGSWWWAGLLGLLASLTRSAGLLLLVPFCYEYLRQHNFQLRAMRFDVSSGLFIPAGTGLFMLYCSIRFQDALAFSHAQAYWGRQLTLPGLGFVRAGWTIAHSGLLSFSGIHTLLDLSMGLLMLLLCLFCFVGPWKFRRDQLSYGLYASASYLFLILFPGRDVPLQSLSRLVIELFPTFIILALMGKKASFNLYYCLFAGALLCFLLLQFLNNFWVV